MLNLFPFKKTIIGIFLVFPAAPACNIYIDKRYYQFLGK